MYTQEAEAVLAKPTAGVEEVAQILGIGRRQAYEAVKRGDIPAIRLGKRILISTRVVRDMLAAGSIPKQAA
ncbi:helix-turn-helix domain-containing protein [Paenarthrobacter sp. Y-19]|uniref:helix-turn-helix domain-containing protein n=1 Tax=Paenarthrobacter sp. Y-19 TaxID=3031125 RepID=UPI0023D9B661|nr:helix-turn-helix domain-containing protein [Paenarthrobacter sp. Y-19]